VQLRFRDEGEGLLRGMIGKLSWPQVIDDCLFSKRRRLHGKEKGGQESEQGQRQDGAGINPDNVSLAT